MALAILSGRPGISGLQSLLAVRANPEPKGSSRQSQGMMNVVVREVRLPGPSRQSIK